MEAEELDLDFVHEVQSAPTSPEQYTALDRAWCVLQQVRRAVNTPVTFETIGLEAADVMVYL